MKSIEFHHGNSLISDEELINLERKLQSEIYHMKSAVSKGYNDDRASINLCDDQEILQGIKSLINEKKALNPKCLIVVGIGGSNLGTLAVQEAVLGKLYNQLDPEIKILYADTVDDDLIHSLISIVEPVLRQGDNVILNGVTKSGGTTETIANFQIFVDLLKKYRKKEYVKYIIVTSDRESQFWDFAQEQGFSTLEIPKKVGGRYSVFSSVGLFPLGLLGLDINELLRGARDIKTRCLQTSIGDNPAAMSASLIYLHKQKKRNIHDLFLFNSDLESLGKWYRQLMGESVGKEFNQSGNQVYEGITPTVSIGSSDLHSMAQLYLGGPFDKFTTFVRVKENKRRINTSDNLEYSTLVKGICGKPLNLILDAILTGVQRAFQKGKRPYVELVLPDKSEYSIGQFLQMKMMEMMYLGYLLDVNPFNQPNVESYKRETRKILEEK